MGRGTCRVVVEREISRCLSYMATFRQVLSEHALLHCPVKFPRLSKELIAIKTIFGIPRSWTLRRRSSSRMASGEADRAHCITGVNQNQADKSALSLRMDLIACNIAACSMIMQHVASRNIAARMFILLIRRIALHNWASVCLDQHNEAVRSYRTHIKQGFW